MWEQSHYIGFLLWMLLFGNAEGSGNLPPNESWFLAAKARHILASAEGLGNLPKSERGLKWVLKTPSL
jgi:hypothetical protein